jgi:hypothetical protein
MKKLIIASALFFSLNNRAQVGKIFPTIDGVSLTDKNMRLPTNNGKQTIVAIAFNKAAEDELKKWLNPLYYTFIKKPKGSTNLDMSEIYDVNFVFIPMISGFKKIAEDFKKGTDKEFWGYIMDTEKTDIKAQQKLLEIKDNKIPYFFVLDKNGKILDVQSGDFKEEKIDKLEEAVD